MRPLFSCTACFKQVVHGRRNTASGARQREFCLRVISARCGACFAGLPMPYS